MASILIAESGSTKTDWYLSRTNKRSTSVKTTGINPYLQTPDDIYQLLDQEKTLRSYTPEEIYFYGAGLGTVEKQKELKKVLKAFFNVKKVDVKSDIYAAARGLSGNEKGMIAILGTGSNCCYYDGRRIKSNTSSLGYVLGDEGSGNHMGKKVINYYAYKTFDSELKDSFEHLYGNDLEIIINNIYKQPFPNRYIASFARFLDANRGHYMVENIIEDSINEFFHQHVLKYRESWKYPLHFTGSIAYSFRDVIKAFCTHSGITLGKISKSPLKGLINYHSQ